MAETSEAPAASARSRTLALALAGAAVVVVVLAVVFTRRDPGPDHFSTWLRQDLHLPSDVVDCVGHRLRAGPLDVGAIERTAPERLRREGVTALPDSQRQLVGDVLIACTVQPDGPGGGS